MNGLRVTSQDLLDKAGDCDREAGNLESKLADLRSFANGMEAMWQGLAHSQFESLMQDFDRYGRQIHQALVSISAELKKNAHNYIDTETGNASGLTNIGESIPAARL
ncbi:WXG100 family type VII secretion target [Dactylosporangium sp. CA-233914]|uniref:WXG100 family type VII secretion target n=1 Tax=Dactylosporangium sp. CA-233914 TaxID=3239934 RepID=UPI003D8CC071